MEHCEGGLNSGGPPRYDPGALTTPDAMNIILQVPPSPEYCFLWIDWWPMCMTKTEWSGWVQAIGAVAAIAIGAGAVWWQVRKAHTAAQEARGAEDIRILSLIAIANFDCIKALKIAKLQREDVSLMHRTLKGFDAHCNELASIPLLQIPDHWVAAVRARAVQEGPRLRYRMFLSRESNVLASIDQSLKEFIECERVLGAALSERGTTLPYSRAEIGVDTVLHEAPKSFAID